MSRENSSNLGAHQGDYAQRHWHSQALLVGQEPQQQNAPQEASPSLPSLEESFARFDQLEKDWAEASNDIRQAFGLSTTDTAEATRARGEAIGRDAGADEYVLQYADTDRISRAQLRARYQGPPAIRLKDDGPDESDKGNHRPQSTMTKQERPTKQAWLEGGSGTEINELGHQNQPAVQGLVSRQRQEQAAVVQPMASGQQSHQGGNQQLPGFKPLSRLVPRLHATSFPPRSQQQQKQPRSQQQRRGTRDVIGSGPTDEYGYLPFLQQAALPQSAIARRPGHDHVPTRLSQPIVQVHAIPLSPRSQQTQDFASFTPTGEHLAKLLHSHIAPTAHLGHVPIIPSDQDQYQPMSWGPLDQAAAAHAEPVAHQPLQYSYGAQVLPPPPANNVQRPRPRHKKTIAVSGALMRPQSGLERTELYRALYPTVVTLLQLKEQSGEQDAQIWVRIEDLRYDEAWNKLGEQITSLLRGTSGPSGDSTAPFQLPKRGSIAEGWVDYIEDWDMPYRGLRSAEERKRWLDYYWNATQREVEKENVAPLDFERSFLESHNAKQFWRDDIEKWELGSRVLVRWDGKKLSIVNMESSQ